ncbi:hypothetical protein D3C87_1891050 [compost metagenome]
MPGPMETGADVQNHPRTRIHSTLDQGRVDGGRFVENAEEAYRHGVVCEAHPILELTPSAFLLAAARKPVGHPPADLHSELRR